ncbi:DUF3618 domain-containing protein [Streptomyces litchfieldiae]|uniref:DUF3618 domain-containing protein n=1 Tax=Streptomyces litchfieldiae TaxID=3075543 RepID=A0ABU2MPC1_9ACTN|nr:DUF3618 domain-containing protein [Streptomyces sp. DSM 44938]MDT0343477.1 DUF3618 domain-containing protein [Streptomyces sp. DSM 44938]
MGTSPDRIRADIEATRAKLADDLDRLADRASPRRMAQRGGENLRASATGVRDRLRGSTPGGMDRARDQGRRAARTTWGAATQAGESAGHAPAQATERTRGNPVVAGAVAFGAGFVAASLMPRTRAEEQAAGQVSDRAGRLAEPVREAAAESAQHLKQDATQAARKAAQNLKESAPGRGR